MNHSDFSSKSCGVLGVVISVILKILVRFGNNCAFYFEIYLKYLNNLKYLKNFELTNHFAHYVDNSDFF